MPLYQEYRPDSLDTLKGNEEIVASLKTMLSNPAKCPHAFLFHGPTGCGKTTLARIIAKELGCVGNDYREIDSADFRGIDTVREISKQSRYKGLEGGTRVFVLDECHKLTGDAQNALLKILEDTPSHVFFLLCTTDPAKILPTVKGRCSQFQVKQLSDKAMLRLLKGIVKSEEETLDQEVYDQIIQDSLGHPRNAIQILEQVLNVPTEKRLKTAQRAQVEQALSIDLCRALLKKANWKEVAEILKGIKDQDPEGVRRQVMGYAQAVLLSKDTPQAGFILEQFVEPFYNSGFPGLVCACYVVIKN